MGSGGEFESSSISDWDWEPTDQEAIEASESLSAKRQRPNPHLDGRCRRCRRLPNWGNPSASGAASAGSPSSPSSARCHRLPHLMKGGENEHTRFFDDSNGSSCPRNENSILIPSPCRFNVKPRYPAMSFRGCIVYSRTYSEVEKATKQLLEIVETKKQNMDQVSLGLDIEWRPTFKSGVAQRKAAVMQICASVDQCFVMHIIHSGIPPILQSLLEDSESIKVGVCIAGDASKIMKDYNVCIKGLHDLSRFANVKLGGVPKMWSLGSLVEMLTCKELEKPRKIRLGNWEVSELSKEQLQYAATDAFASWHLYQVLTSFPDVAKIEGTEEKVNAVQS